MPFRNGHLPGVDLQVDPAVLELAGVVVGERGERAVLVRRHEQPGLEQHLEAVADAEDELLGVAELAEGVGRGSAASWLARILPAATSSP